MKIYTKIDPKTTYLDDDKNYLYIPDRGSAYNRKMEAKAREKRKNSMVLKSMKIGEEFNEPYYKGNFHSLKSEKKAANKRIRKCWNIPSKGRQYQNVFALQI